MPISLPESAVQTMNNDAIATMARPLSSGRWFHISGANQSIKSLDEEWEYTIAEARAAFWKRIPTVSLVQWLLARADKMQDLSDKVASFIPRSVFPDDEDIIRFLGLSSSQYLLRPDIRFFGWYRMLTPTAMWGYGVGTAVKDKKYKVRLLLED
jgi:hypothetical protein